jgi:hypothetical protein
MKTKHILALDPGLIQTGYAICNRKGHGIESGTFTPNPKDNTAHRIHEICVDLRGLLAQYEIGHAIVETMAGGFSYTKHTSKGEDGKPKGKPLNTFDLMKNFAVTMNLCTVLLDHNIKVYHASADKWKGKANKEWAMLASGIKNHNQAEAYELLRWFMNQGKQILEG